LARLLELASSYFDLSFFPEGETKKALQRIANKKSCKIEGNGLPPKKKPKASGTKRDLLTEKLSSLKI
jgi:pre-mRNA-splicing factor ATP-dependent RNA helicase DHX15/PRP43